MQIKRSGSQPSQVGPADYFTAMTHIAIQESLDGKAVEWLEKVTDDQYQGKV